MNTVTPENFNHTMHGYIKFAEQFAKMKLSELGYEEKQLYDFFRYFYTGLNWAKDDMTMEDARNYYDR